MQWEGEGRKATEGSPAGFQTGIKRAYIFLVVVAVAEETKTQRDDTQRGHVCRPILFLFPNPVEGHILPLVVSGEAAQNVKIPYEQERTRMGAVGRAPHRAEQISGGAQERRKSCPTLLALSAAK